MIQLTEHELEILEQAKEANPWWFKAVTIAANIMSQRRKKYAGTHHPYFNFVDMVYRNGLSISQVFKFYLNIKASRVSTTEEDFSDERIVDSWIDAANYALIGAGWWAGGLTENQVLTQDEWKNTVEENLPDDAKF